MWASALLLCWELPLGTFSVGFNYLFIFPPGYVALWGSKAYHRLASESVSWCLETSLFLKTLPRMDPHPYLFCLSFYLLYFSYLLSKTMGCFSGCLMSSSGIQKLFCGIFSAFKCSFDEFIGEKEVSPSYSSTILGMPPGLCFKVLSYNANWGSFYPLASPVSIQLLLHPIQSCLFLFWVFCYSRFLCSSARSAHWK